MKSVLISVALAILLTTCNVAVAGEVVTYYYTDAQGTPLATTDAQGNITSTADYRPYAEQAFGQLTNGPGYAGHVNDADTDLVYMQARYYDPSVGRFLSVDPADLGLGNPFSFNRYGYASNNPIVNIDPDGREDKRVLLLPKQSDVLTLAGHAIAADVAYAQGAITGNDALKSIATEAMRNDVADQGGGEAIVALVMTGEGGEGGEIAGPEIQTSMPEVQLPPGVKAGSSGGPGAGKAFSPRIKDQAEAQAEGNCVFCGVKTTREPGPTQRNTDHSIPKSRGGNNTIDNANNSCASCNQDKRASTSQEYIQKKDGT